MGLVHGPDATKSTRDRLPGARDATLSVVSLGPGASLLSRPGEDQCEPAGRAKSACYTPPPVAPTGIGAGQ
jgi:hypothetical protein